MTKIDNTIRLTKIEKTLAALEKSEAALLSTWDDVCSLAAEEAVKFAEKSGSATAASRILGVPVKHYSDISRNALTQRYRARARHFLEKLQSYKAGRG